MPYLIQKVRNKNCFKVINKETGRILARCTTREKAEKQIRLLHMIDTSVELNRSRK